jgi:hypothetical protein
VLKKKTYFWAIFTAFMLKLALTRKDIFLGNIHCMHAEALLLKKIHISW